MENPYGNNVNPSQYAAWEHGRKAGKAGQAGIVRELVEILGDMVRDAELNHGKVTNSARQAAERAIAKATGI